MEIVLEKKDNTNATLKVNLKEADYKPRVAEKLKEYGKKVQMKGFRPGKVPPTLVNKMYGKSILVDEINTLLSESVVNYIREQKIQVVGDPLPKSDDAATIDWDTQKEFDFSYELGIVPEFSFELSDKVKVNKYSIKVEDKVLDETLQNLRSQFGEMVDAEVVSEGDFIKGILKETASDFSTDTLIPVNKVKKDMQSVFVGQKNGATVEFDIEKAFDADEIAYVSGLSKEEAEKKKGKFTFAISNIRHSQLAEVNQAFYDRVFGKDVVTTEEDFNNRLRETVAKNYSREAQNLFRYDVKKQLLDQTNIELPGEFLKKWLLKVNKGVTPEQVENEFDIYTRELKWSLIKNKISETHEVKVEYDEILNHTKKMFTEQLGGMVLSDSMEESLNKVAANYLTNEGAKNYMKMYEAVEAEKIMDLIVSKVGVTEKEVDVEEFKKQAEA